MTRVDSSLPSAGESGRESTSSAGAGSAAAAASATASVARPQQAKLATGRVAKKKPAVTKKVDLEKKCKDNIQHMLGFATENALTNPLFEPLASEFRFIDKQLFNGEYRLAGDSGVCDVQRYVTDARRALDLPVASRRKRWPLRFEGWLQDLIELAEEQKKTQDTSGATGGQAVVAVAAPAASVRQNVTLSVARMPIAHSSSSSAASPAGSSASPSGALSPAMSLGATSSSQVASSSSSSYPASLMASMAALSSFARELDQTPPNVPSSTPVVPPPGPSPSPEPPSESSAPRPGTVREALHKLLHINNALEADLKLTREELARQRDATREMYEHAARMSRQLISIQAQVTEMATTTSADTDATRHTAAAAATTTLPPPGGPSIAAAAAANSAESASGAPMSSPLLIRLPMDLFRTGQKRSLTPVTESPTNDSAMEGRHEASDDDDEDVPAAKKARTQI